MSEHSAGLENNKTLSPDIRLFQVVAHDIKSPINAIIGTVNLAEHLLEVGIDKEELSKLLDLIKKSCYQVTDLADDILELAKMESAEFQLEKKPVVLEDFLLQYINTHRLLTLKKRIQIDFNSKSNGVALVNESKMTRVIDNVMSNAIKFSHPESRILIQVTEQDSMMIITIKDHGIGMSESIVESLFTKFGNAQRPGLEGEKSHGLGMSIVKQIMELHGGSVTVSSEEGEGTEVELSIEKFKV